MIAVVASGLNTMSDSLIAFHPRMELPSKPNPSLKESSTSLCIGIVVCCQMPSRSTNLKSTNLAPFFSAYFSTSAGVMAILLCPSQAVECDCLLQRVLAPFTGADADHLVDRGDEDLAVTDVAGARHREQRFYHVLRHLVLHDDLHHDLGNE